MISNLEFSRVKTIAMSILRIILTTVFFSLLTIRVLMGAPATNHFTFLANAFNHGSFSVGALPDSYADVITMGDQAYLPMGPAPAMLLMPFVSIFGIAFDEVWLTLALTALNAWVFRLILIEIGITDAPKRVWLLVLFFAGTIYLATMMLGRSWFLAHIVGILYTLLAINHALRKGSAFGVGVLLGMAFLVRASIAFAFPFFLILIWQKADWSRRLRYTALLFAGMAVPLLFFFYYNYARFGSLLDTGYARALPGVPVLREAMRYGLFSLAHVPKNLYMLFFAPPQPVRGLNAPVLNFPWILPSRWGMGIFFTTPAVIYAFFANHRTRVIQAAWVAVLAILPSLLFYYGVGYDQFGYRYAIDFYPFLFIIVALGLAARWNITAKVMIVLSVVINLWGAWCAMFGLFADPG